MKDNISCSVVQDLLPLYVDGLTAEETNKIIEQHIKECSGCKERYDSMKEEFHGEETEKAEETRIEVDYLKKVRNNNRRKVIMGVGTALLAMAALIVGKMFFYGSPVESYTASMSVDGDKVLIQGEISDSDLAYSHYRIVEEDGQKKVLIYGVYSSFVNKNNTFEIECSLDETGDTGLSAGEEMVNAEGKIVSTKAADIFANKNSYVGDISKDLALAHAIGIGEDLGTFTNELQTTVEPYGWTLYFTSTLEESNEAMFNEKMRAYAYVLLASIDNVDEISWSYLLNTADGTEQKVETLTVLEADSILKDEVKSYGTSIARMDELLKKVGLINGISTLTEYKYRLTLTGRSPNAAKDSTFVVLTNNPNLTFDEVAKSLYSSNSADWLEDTVIVSME